MLILIKKAPPGTGQYYKICLRTPGGLGLIDCRVTGSLQIPFLDPLTDIIGHAWDRKVDNHNLYVDYIEEATVEMRSDLLEILESHSIIATYSELDRVPLELRERSSLVFMGTEVFGA